jgi:hypothetical protein
VDETTLKNGKAQKMKQYQNNSERFGDLGVIVTREGMIELVKYWRANDQWDEDYYNNTPEEEIDQAIRDGELIEL